MLRRKVRRFVRVHRFLGQIAYHHHHMLDSLFQRLRENSYSFSEQEKSHFVQCLNCMIEGCSVFTAERTPQYMYYMKKRCVNQLNMFRNMSEADRSPEMEAFRTRFDEAVDCLR